MHGEENMNTTSESATSEAEVVAPPEGKIFADMDGKLIGVFAGFEPDGAFQEVTSLPPVPESLWVDGEWVQPDPMIALREVAAMSRQAFCLALFRAQILTEADAIAAAKGEWPTALDDLLTALPDTEAAEARIVWATSSEIRRLHPLLASIASHMGIDDATLDQIFGLTEQEAESDD